MSEAAYTALVEALGEVCNPPKNRVVEVPGRYRFEYADLASMLACVRPVLARHQLALIQPVRMQQGQILVTSKLIHASGTVVAECELSCRDPVQPQAQGSQITYLRRYGMSSLLGIAAEDDDDGAAAADLPAEHAPKRPAALPPALVHRVEARAEVRGESKADSKEEDGVRDRLKGVLDAAGVTEAQVDAARAKMNKLALGELDDRSLEEVVVWLSGAAGQRWLGGLKSEGLRLVG
jgi:hypothetical protein